MRTTGHCMGWAAGSSAARSEPDDPGRDERRRGGDGRRPSVARLRESPPTEPSGGTQPLCDRGVANPIYAQ
jgi:hypothetical protein